MTKNLPKMIELICSNPKCPRGGEPFLRSATKYKSAHKWGQSKFYCSPQCNWDDNTGRPKNAQE